LGPAELSVLSSWYDWLENNLNIHLDLIVYLRSAFAAEVMPPSPLRKRIF
jgi:hypothetical protein